MYPFTFNTFITYTILALITAASATPKALDLFGGLTLLNTPPPAFMLTADPSPQCSGLNQGSLLCCQDTLNGDAPAVVAAAALVGYELNPNSVNGLYCTSDGHLFLQSITNG